MSKLILKLPRMISHGNTQHSKMQITVEADPTDIQDLWEAGLVSPNNSVRSFVAHLKGMTAEEIRESEMDDIERGTL